MKSRTARLVAYALLFALLTPLAVQASDWATVKPKQGGKKTTLLIYGKRRTYYRLAPGESMEYQIGKNDPVRIFTRADIRGSKAKETIYSFRVGFNRNKTRLMARASIPDKNVTIRGKESAATESRIIEVDGQTTPKTLVIKLGSKAAHPVFFRVQRERPEPDIDGHYIAITPVGYTKAVGLSVRENLTTYYQVDEEKRLTVEVNGPTTMKILARVMLDDSMRGTIKFPLAVYEDGTLKNTYRISTTASDVSVLVDRPDRRPTRGDDLYLDVPEGRHRYSFELPENQYDAILRFFLPEKDLAREAGK